MAINIEMRFGSAVRLFLCLLMGAMLLIGCKSTRTVVNTKIKADSTEIMDKTSKAVIISNMEQSQTMRDLSVFTDDMTETVTALLWTVPDSSGKQYVISKTITVRTRSSKKANKIQEVNSITDQAESNITIKDNSERKVDYKTAVTSDKKTKISTPGVISWGVLIIILFVIIIIILILKKYKLL